MRKSARTIGQKCPKPWGVLGKTMGNLGQNHGEPWAKSMMTLHIIAYTFYHNICKYLSVACLH
ncbi:MAG: hypothetical protein EGR43_06755 [Prevotella sp.]|nr:hypothetical protein [Prevotella sp.]